MALASTRKIGVLPFLNVYTVACLLAVGIIGFYLRLTAPDDKTGLSSLYFLMLLQLTPFMLCFARGHYDFMAFIMFNHFVTYSLSKLNAVRDIIKIGPLPPIAIVAINELVLCTTLVIGGFYLSRLFLFRRFVLKSTYQMLSLSRWQLLMLTMYVIAMPLYIKLLPPTFVAMHFTVLAADMALLMSSDSPGNEQLAKYLRLGVYVSCIWYFLATGALMMLGFLAGYAFIAACLKREYKKLIGPLIMTFVASGIQPVKVHFRMALLDNPDMPMGQRAEFLADLIYMQYFDDTGLKAKLDEAAEDASPDSKDGEEKDANSDTLLQGFARMGDESLERVLDMTPSKVPFWGGSSYSALPFIFIPRFIWPDKPSRHIWNDFGRTYKYLSEDDFQTSVTVNFFAEAYMNFGFFGMYCVSIFIGFLAAFIERMSYYLLGGWFYFTFLVFLAPLVQFGSDLTSIINSIFIVTSIVMGLRQQLLRMALTDDYV